jgi:hypothetical protein
MEVSKLTWAVLIGKMLHGTDRTYMEAPNRSIDEFPMVRPCCLFSWLRDELESSCIDHLPPPWFQSYLLHRSGRLELPTLEMTIIKPKGSHINIINIMIIPSSSNYLPCQHQSDYSPFEKVQRPLVRNHQTNVHSELELSVPAAWLHIEYESNCCHQPHIEEYHRKP